ncbi:SigE family RNA polymerase sigma factor [Virgisporangium aurantiacum]|uniref:RNA polymerase n=1 Tax=Virgisporangium aurantiacum TaxID=175570 RepID=A0A8J4DXI6_9ACTN|nr:SigE family RNA polymerase sigma factor [Virgisporangium aurantiacum]GIJ53621.1 RNA polymerase [Virgisporangium aurantiacum]
MTEARNDSFDDFVVNRGPALLRFAYLLTGDRHRAEDLVQEVLARVHQRWNRIERAEGAEFYVRTALVRQNISWWRRRSARSEQPVAEVPETAADGSEHSLAARDEMWNLLATLPRKQRAVLVLRFYEDLPDDRIAALLGCSTVTVRVQASRALARLRATLSDKNITTRREQ